MKIKKIVLLKFAKILLLTVVGFSLFPSYLSAQETIRFGVLAHCGREHCLERWEPTTIFLNNQLEKYTFIIKPLGFDEIYPAVESGEVEFVLVNPACYATIEARYGAQRIATIKYKDCHGQTCKTFFGGVIFSRSGREDLKTLSQIVGKRFMAVHKNSFGGWHMARRKLLENEIDPAKDCSSLEFGLTHDAVVKAVQEGRVDVGTVRSGTLERMSREGTIKLADFQVLGQPLATPGFSLLHSTRLYPEWPLAKLAHTDEGLAEKVVATLLTLGDTNKNEKNLTCPAWTIPQNYQSVHECLKILRITPYEHYGEITFKDIFRAHWATFIGLLIFIVMAFVVFAYIQKLRVKMQAQAALQQSRDFLQTVIDANPDPIMVISRDYKITLSNRAARKIVGGRQDGQFVDGINCYEYFHGRKQPCSGDDFQCPLSTKKIDHAVLIVERTYCDADGNEQNYEVAIAPIIDKSGEDLGVVESFRDISKRKKAEKARQRLERAVEQSGETIVITDSKGTIQYVNPAFVRITGYSRDEAIGQNPRVLKSGQHSSDFYQNMWKTLLAGRTWQGEFINRKKDGSDYYEEATISPIFDDDNQITNFIAVKRDVTPLKKSQQLKKELEEQLAQSQKMEAVGTLAGGIAHDFNNILTSILGFSELTLLDLPDGSNAKKDIDQVIASGKRAKDLVKQILTFSRKEPQNIQTLNPYIVIKEALKMLRSSLPTTVNIVEDVDPECGEVEADSTQLHQVVMNLCTNAFHAMKEQKGTLKVSLQRVEKDHEETTGEPAMSTDSFIVLSVSDTGCGMDQATKERIFDPYFTTKEVGEGTGLGLAVIHGIVESCDGFIEVESEPGHGSTFQVYIPALERKIVGSQQETEKNRTLLTGMERIMVVDDEVAILKLHETLLQRLGYQVTSTTDSRVALAEIHNHPDQFDLIITDQSMPNLSGVELTSEVLKIKPTMPIILCTGYSSIVSEEEALAMGVKKYAKKPISIKGFAKIVRQVLDED
ncbi:MAG: PAS domain S-box protein [Pseudomonadota bacterium]|nr:PAS domain S-box protein [Pseudomonadota bacterium]